MRKTGALDVGHFFGDPSVDPGIEPRIGFAEQNLAGLHPRSQVIHENAMTRIHG
jgi:hypothetical protein